MAVMLTQWSPVPWSGETVSRLALPPPAEGAAPTPIYEALVHEWSRAGRTVPRQARSGYEEHEEGGGGLGRWRTGEGVHRPYGAGPPASPGPSPAAAQALASAGPGGSSDGASSPFLPGHDETRHDEAGHGEAGHGEARHGEFADGEAAQGAHREAGSRETGSRRDAVAGGEAAPGSGQEREAAVAAPAEPKPPAWERVAIL